MTVLSFPYPYTSNVWTLLQCMVSYPALPFSSPFINPLYFINSVFVMAPSLLNSNITWKNSPAKTPITPLMTANPPNPNVEASLEIPLVTTCCQ